MTRLIEFLIALGIVAVLALVIGVVLPSHRHISESVETNRKMTIVYDTVNNLRRFKDWNPLVLRDPKIQLNVSGAESGVGARLDYVSQESHIGKGSWQITESVPNEKVVIQVEDERRGDDKIVQFLLEPTGKNNRNVKITQTYDVDYGWNLLGRYAGLYVSRHVGDDVKLGLSRLTNMLATVPNFDYRADGVPLRGLKIAELPAEDLLVVNAGNIERNNEAIKQSIKNNQEWIKRTLEASNLEAAGPVRIITTDFGQEKYAFDVAVPVRRKGSAPAAAAPAPAAEGENADAAAAAAAEAAKAPAVLAAASGEELKVTIPAGAPVQYVRTAPHRAAFGQYTGYMAELDAVRSSVRAWALTNGYEVTDRPFEIWKGGVDKAFTAEGEYDVYWQIK
ncbi:polyketide cyclase [Pseudoxanthomonas jiangsuensis]|uniref:polyketide cyclase n=1 Tax=Pseudoxanthomonas jiangsuensis TaxID=619688 RepID=UPI001390FA2E|nr:polyketide cyclase [Pseudoxanthomonas jiangsuensis]KAF1692716.1 polyketide cyclase [Pseudoxanthomonas jiangsuensis]